MTDQESAAALSAANQEIESLKARMARLEKFNWSLPRTWLLSSSFLKRAFGVLGLDIVAAMIIAIPFYVFCFIIFLVRGCR